MDNAAMFAWGRGLQVSTWFFKKNWLLPRNAGITFGPV